MKKVLCSAEKSSVIWAEPHSRSSDEQFGQTEHSVGHYCTQHTQYGSSNHKVAYSRTASLKYCAGN